MTPRGDVRADLLSDMAAVDAIAGEWRALPAPAAAPCPTSGPEFLEAWLATLGRDASPGSSRSAAGTGWWGWCRWSRRRCGRGTAAAR